MVKAPAHAQKKWRQKELRVALVARVNHRRDRRVGERALVAERLQQGYERLREDGPGILALVGQQWQGRRRPHQSLTSLQASNSRPASVKGSE